MRILLAESLSYFNLGGAAKACRGLIDGLAQRGHSCVVVSIENRHELEEKGLRVDETRGAMRLEVNGIEIFAVENAREQWRPLLECFRTFNPDWIFISEQRALLLATALEYDPSRIILLVQTIVLPAPSKSAAVIKEQVRSLVANIAGVLTVSNYMRDYIKHWSGLDSTAIYLPSYGCGPFTNFHNFDRGYVTMLNPCAYKGISIFLPLARSLPEIKFAVVTFWGTTQQDRAALAGLPNVKQLKPFANLDNLFSRTKVLLVPSLWGEAFGQIVVDAMLRGIPVIASNAGALPEAKLGVDYVLPVNMIERYVFDSEMQVQPVVPEQDVTQWTETLRDLLADRALYERVSHDSREAALAFVNSLGPHHIEQYLGGLTANGKRAAAKSAAA